MDIQVTWQTLLAVAGGFVLLAQAGRIIINMFNPIRELQKKQERQEGFLAADKERLDKLDKAIDRLDEALSLLGLAVSDLINHEITGNDSDRLKQTQKKLNEYFYRGKE